MVRYATRTGEYEDEHEAAAATYTWGVTDLDRAGEEMTALASVSRCKEPIVSVILSWSTGEHPTLDQVKEAVEIAMRHLGLEGCQAVAALHRDTDNDHVHLIVNRVDRTGKARDLWQSETKLYEATREIEHVQGWKPEIHVDREYDRATKNYETWASRSSIARELGAELHEGVTAIAQNPSATWRDVHAVMRDHGLRYVVSEFGGRIERRDEPGIGAGARDTLGFTHKELVQRLGTYTPDYVGDRAFEDRVHSATLATLSLRSQGGDWDGVHEIMADHGLRYERYGGGARIVDLQNGDTMKAGEEDRRLRLGEMKKSFGEFVDADSTRSAREARDASRYAENIAKAAQLEDNPDLLLRKMVSHNSTFTLAELKRRVADDVMNSDQRDGVLKSALEHSVALTGDGGTIYTTETVLAEQMRLKDAVTSLASQQVMAPMREAGDHLDEQQQAAYVYATRGTRLSLITGVPGSGKTHVIEDVGKAWADAGYEVRAVSVTNAACDELLDKTSLPVRNVAKELYEWSQARALPSNRTVLIVDEISQLGSEQGEQLLTALNKAGGVVIGFGDDRQFLAVGRGDTLRSVAEALGEDQIDLEKTRRQTIEWQREATHLMRAGDIREGLSLYEQHGRIVACDTREDAVNDLVGRYFTAMDAGKTQALMAYTNADTDSLNDRAREVARERGDLQGEDVSVKTAFGERSFAVGDTVLLRDTFLMDEPGLRGTNGQTTRLTAIDNERMLLERISDGATLTIDTTVEPRINHGYARTKHRTQGATVDEGLTLWSRVDDARSALVSMTRHEENAIMAYAKTDFANFGDLVAHSSRISTKDMATDYAVEAMPSRHVGGLESLVEERDCEYERSYDIDL